MRMFSLLTTGLPSVGRSMALYTSARILAFTSFKTPRCSKLSFTTKNKEGQIQNQAFFHGQIIAVLNNVGLTIITTTVLLNIIFLILVVEVVLVVVLLFKPGVNLYTALKQLLWVWLTNTVTKLYFQTCLNFYPINFNMIFNDLSPFINVLLCLDFIYFSFFLSYQLLLHIDF